MSDAILTLNVGSSTVKFALYDRETLFEVHRGTIESTHDRAMDQALEVARRAQRSIVGIGHRVVHGGTVYSAPVKVDEQVVTHLRSFIPLAPLHQPFNVEGVVAAIRAFPAATQVACFDTAFHRGRPFVDETYALPRRFFDEGIRRFGFHGLSYQFVSRRLGEVAPEVARGRVVIAHLGSGASMCGIREGRSVATSMGFSTLDGIPMGTRCGALDPGVVLHLLEQKRMSVKDVEHVLYKESGLKGLSEISADMRALLASPSDSAREAVEYFVDRCAREVASLATALGGLDALVFTAGIGERSEVVRQKIVGRLAWLGLELDGAANHANAVRISSTNSKGHVLVVPTNEELCIAQSTAALV